MTEVLIVNDLLTRLRTDLAALADEETRLKHARFFKEAVRYYGVAQPRLQQLAREYWPEVSALRRPEAYRLFEDMLATDYSEPAFLVAAWLPRFKSQFQRKDLALFKRWIDRYLNNWAKVDSFCNHSLADFLERFPESVAEIASWTGSKNRWLQRAAAVSLILPARRGEFLDEAFAIAEALLESPDDMVQKGYGWLLKEASRLHQQEVFDFVVARKAVMPRTALRYAIELMPKELKAEAMKK
jgi:3-methyladenine DNA glycosylase AlkD